MSDTSNRLRPQWRPLEAALLVGALALVVDSVLGVARARRERRQHAEALTTWEGEGGTPPQDRKAPTQQ